MSEQDKRLDMHMWWLAGLSVVVVLLALNALGYKASVSEKMGNYASALPGSSIAHQSVQSAGNQGSGDNIYHPGSGVRGDGMLSYEPPVFWNAGDMAKIEKHQYAASQASKHWDAVPDEFKQEGMKVAAKRGAYTGHPLETFSGDRLNPY